MRVIYTSKGISKKFWCALYIRCALSIEKYGKSFFCEQWSRVNKEMQQKGQMEHKIIDVCSDTFIQRHK